MVKMKAIELREIPMLMKPEMARATNLGLKTETRRLTGLEAVNFKPDQWKLYYMGKHLKDSKGNPEERAWAMFKKGDETITVKCPYGTQDDMLWIRENWNKDGHGGYRYASDFPDHDSLLWKSSLHMHKIIARTWCQVVDIRVERLHDIHYDDAINEGINLFFDRVKYRIPTRRKAIMLTTDDPVEAYLNYVNSLSNLTMKQNPWVWVIQYQVMSTEGKPRFIEEVETDLIFI